MKNIRECYPDYGIGKMITDKKTSPVDLAMEYLDNSHLLPIHFPSYEESYANLLQITKYIVEKLGMEFVIGRDFDRQKGLGEDYIKLLSSHYFDLDLGRALIKLALLNYKYLDVLLQNEDNASKAKDPLKDLLNDAEELLEHSFATNELKLRPKLIIEVYKQRLKA